MANPRTFPFGVPMRHVLQKQDGTRKRAFVVGIYSSAVHARWVGPDGLTKVAALAVANEPYIFWRGENAPEYIPTIDRRFGHLELPSSDNNGPSGRALDVGYLKPLGLSRDAVWLSDLVPHSLSNKGQQSAIESHYRPFGLPESTIPLVPANTAGWLTHIDLDRLLNDLKQSDADTIITLGNLPIKCFLNCASNCRFSGLTELGYGLPQDALIQDRSYKVIRLAHMRVTAIRPIPHWSRIHSDWMASNPGL